MLFGGSAVISFIVCDDIKEHSLYIKNLIEENCKINHQIFDVDNKNDLYNLLEKNDTNIVFMDIVLENTPENGIDIIKEVCSKYPNTVIIFMSGYTDYYENVYEVDHIYFLKKPINIHHFHNALEKAIRKSDKINNDFFALKTKKSTLKLPYDDILYFESSKHNINILLKDTAMTVYSMKLSEIEKIVNSDLFTRCHQSYIVNLSKISRIEKHTAFLENGHSIPISKRYLSDIKNLFTLYLGDEL